MNTHPKITRRHFLQASLASATYLSLPAIAKGANKQKKRIVWVVLRGAQDSLHTVIPYSDSCLSKYRPTIVDKELLAHAHKLDKQFALHPKLTSLSQLYQQGQLAPVVAVSSGYKGRSHFDGQDYLESGQVKFAYDSGWINRLIESSHKSALGVSKTMPIALRGKEKAATWYPSSLKSASDDLYSALQKMYQNDERLLSSLKEGVAANNLVDKSEQKKRAGSFVNLAKTQRN